ncbi:MAG: hypothetical protein AB7N91_31550 [Candidatus Tectimicrobiota bacterium]
MDVYKHRKSSIIASLLLTGCLASFSAADEPQRGKGQAPTWETLQAVQATPLEAHEMHAVAGKGPRVNIAQFLRNQAIGVQVAPGVTVWGFSSDGDPFAVTATWNTGSSRGNATPRLSSPSSSLVK